MNRHQIVQLLTVFPCAFLVQTASALVVTSEKGTWPKDWPKEMEPLRKSARTIDIGTLIQQKIYEIRFSDRETFERVWPVLLKLKTPEAPLALYQKTSDPPKMWGSLLSNATAAVRIYAPSGDYSVNPKIDPIESRENFKKVLDDGQALHAAPPWPDYLTTEKGGLPEFVKMVVNDSELKWIPAKPGQGGSRARVEMDVVVDGKVIDLNRIPLPPHTPILDHRFESAGD